MINLRKSEGFSLVELMIVVAIMAILAAIAIPSYLNFQMKARESEARTNLAAIGTCEESYKAENDKYLNCEAHPDAVPGSTPADWESPDDFTSIGFTPAGKVRYQYAVAVAEATASTLFEGTSTGDLDGNGEEAKFKVTNTSSVEKLDEAPNLATYY